MSIDEYGISLEIRVKNNELLHLIFAKIELKGS